jgi:radical SAM protein with 4Fe4S-binding SPASM domain
MPTRSSEPILSTHLHQLGRVHGLPISGTFELTARCNFNCPMCYIHLQQDDIDARGRELTAQQWIELGRQAKEAGMVFLLLTGGEPFVRKDFFEIYDALKKMGLLVSINSNGSMLKGEVLRKLLENPPHRINITLYGGCSDTYKNMCGLNAFDTVVENIRALKQAGVDVRLNLSITPYNCQDIEKIYAISQELNVHVKASSYMYPAIRVHSDYGCNDRLSPEDAAKYMVEWDRLRLSREEFNAKAQAFKNHTATFERECSADLDEGVSCRAGTTSFWMTWDGRMLPCGMMPDPAVYPLETGFQAAWQQLRKETALIRMPKECTACPNRKVCSVCAAICLTETGGYQERPGYVCRMTQGVIRNTIERSDIK